MKNKVPKFYYLLHCGHKTDFHKVWFWNRMGWLWIIDTHNLCIESNKYNMSIKIAIYT